MVIPTTYDPWTRYFPPVIREKWGAFLREIHNYGEDTFWDDLRFPLSGQRLNSASGRVTYNYTENTVDFATNARYSEEPIIMIAQIEHKVAEGEDIYPHLHWAQEEDNDPNWLFRYRYKKKGAAPSAWTLAIPLTARVYTYTAGEIHQLTTFPTLTGHTLTLSDIIDIQLYRDSANASTLFAGADPYTVAARAMEFDLHVQIDQPGSSSEYVK